MTWSVSAWAKVPGKVIIAGEHAVIYDQPAIASAIHLATLATCQWRSVPKYTGTLTLNLPQYQWQVKYPIAQLLTFSQGVIERHQAFLAGKLKQQYVLPQHGDLLIAALGYVTYLADIPALNGLSALVNHGDITIDISTDLLLGAGMGSSASLVAACLAALLDTAQLAAQAPPEVSSLRLTDLTRSQWQAMLFDLTHVCEQWQHGSSSGLDPKVCIYGGGWLMQQSHSNKIVMPIISQLFLVNTGIPQSTTGECVAFVAQRFGAASDSILWQHFGDISKKLAVIFSQTNNLDPSVEPDFIKALRDNQHLLTSLGVVPDQVAKFVAAIEQRQGAAKISGAGSITDHSAGLMLVAGISEQDIAAICQSYGYDYWVFQPHSHGVMFSHETTKADI